MAGPDAPNVIVPLPGQATLVSAPTTAEMRDSVLAAAVAARTILPVIGVPIDTAPQMVGNEALAITAQMPMGVPVATVGVESAVNAAVLAAQIIAITDTDVQAALWKFKDDLAEGLKL